MMARICWFWPVTEQSAVVCTWDTVPEPSQPDTSSTSTQVNEPIKSLRMGFSARCVPDCYKPGSVTATSGWPAVLNSRQCAAKVRPLSGWRYRGARSARGLSTEAYRRISGRGGEAVRLDAWLVARVLSD